MNLNNKTAIITGASRGIGKCIATMLAEHGCNVMLTARDTVKLKGVCENIINNGGQAAFTKCDVSSETDINNAVNATIQQFGRIDIVVNNAGIGRYGPLESSTTADWDAMMNVNARGTYLLCRQSIPYLRQQKQSFIINIGSVVSHKGYADQAIYAASKQAMLGMSKALARELQADNIRVHAVCPGGVATDLVAQARPDLDRTVLMHPDEIADVVLFLVTRRGNAVIDEINIRRAASTPWA